MAEEQLRSLIQRNDTASKSWHPMPTIADMAGMDFGPGVAIIVTCADPRNDAISYLGLSPGECPIIRNAGGRVTEDVLTSLELMSTVMPISTLIIIHHTDCGGIFMTDDGVRSALSERSPENAKSVEHKSWNSFHDIGMEQSIRDDVTAMKKWKFLPKGAVVGGYTFDIKTGKLQEVV